MSQQTTCIDSGMLCTAVASPCQTLRELLAAETTNAYKEPNPSISGTAHAQLAEYCGAYIMTGHAHVALVLGMRIPTRNHVCHM